MTPRIVCVSWAIECAGVADKNEVDLAWWPACRACRSAWRHRVLAAGSKGLARSPKMASAINVFPFSALPPSQAVRDVESPLSAAVYHPEILPKHQPQPEIQTKGGWPSPGRDYRRR